MTAVDAIQYIDSVEMQTKWWLIHTALYVFLYS